MSKGLPDHTPATLGDVRVVSLASLLAQAEVPCAAGCDNGRINNMAAVDAWEAEHAEELRAFAEDRRRRHSAVVSREESALTKTRPEWSFHCDCEGTGFLLTADGHALIKFLNRHLHQLLNLPLRHERENGPRILPCSDANGGA